MGDELVFICLESSLIPKTLYLQKYTTITKSLEADVWGSKETSIVLDREDGIILVDQINLYIPSRGLRDQYYSHIEHLFSKVNLRDLFNEE